MQKYKVQGEVRPGDRNVIVNVETLDKIARCGQRRGGQRTEPWGSPVSKVQEMDEGRKKKGKKEGEKRGRGTEGEKREGGEERNAGRQEGIYSGSQLKRHLKEVG